MCLRCVCVHSACIFQAHKSLNWKMLTEPTTRCPRAGYTSPPTTRHPASAPTLSPPHLPPPFSCLHIIHRLCLSQASHKFTAHTLISPECNPRSEQYPALSTPVVLYALPGTFSYLYLRATVSSLSLSLLLLLLLATLLIDMPPLGSSNHR